MKKIISILFLTACCLISSCGRLSEEVVDNENLNNIVDDKNTNSGDSDTVDNCDNLNFDKEVEVRKYDTVKNKNGNLYLDFTVDNYVTDSGLNPYNIKQTIAASDLVVVCSVKEYVSTLYMEEISPGFPEIYYVPLAVSINEVVKGDISVENSDIIIGNDGGYLSLDVFAEYIDKETDLSLYPEASGVRISYEEILPESGDKYVFCLYNISDEDFKQLGVENPTYNHIVYAKYLISDGFIYLNGNVISDEESFLANINDNNWLSSVDKPNWAVDITYVPYNTYLDMETSYGSEDTYRMVYIAESSPEKPYGIGYHIWQMTNDGIVAKVEDYVYTTPEFDSYFYEEISGVKVKVITVPGERSCACVYFSLPEIDFLIEGVYVDGTSELLNIATALIYEYQSVMK